MQHVHYFCLYANLLVYLWLKFLSLGPTPYAESQTVVTFKFKGYNESNLLELPCMNKKALKVALPFHETRILRTLDNFLHSNKKEGKHD